MSGRAMDSTTEFDDVFANKDDDFWEAEAEQCHRWVMLMYRLRKDCQMRRVYGVSEDKNWSYIEQLYRAQDLFKAQYHLVLAYEHLIRAGYTLDDLLRSLIDEHSEIAVPA